MPCTDDRDRPFRDVFRDHGGGALERAARLEDENRRLRAEIERLRRQEGPPDASTASLKTMHAFLVGVASAATCLGVALVCLAHPHTPRRRAVAPPPAAWNAAEHRQFATPIVRDDHDCRVPFWVDAKGSRHYKFACIE